MWSAMRNLFARAAQSCRPLVQGSTASEVSDPWMLIWARQRRLGNRWVIDSALDSNGMSGETYQSDLTAVALGPTHGGCPSALARAYVSLWRLQGLVMSLEQGLQRFVRYVGLEQRQRGHLPSSLELGTPSRMISRARFVLREAPSPFVFDSGVWRWSICSGRLWAASLAMSDRSLDVLGHVWPSAFSAYQSTRASASEACGAELQCM